MFAVELTQTAFEPGVFGLTEVARAGMRAVLSEAGRQVIDYLRSLTGEMRPPVEAGGAMRPAHPGHWADVTGALAAGYDFRVEDTNDGVQLVLLNDVGYAVFLEAHDGFFVLKGVADAGGPVSQAMRSVVSEIMPGWEVRNA
jgi:hypothetical protein